MTFTNAFLDSKIVSYGREFVSGNTDSQYERLGEEDDSLLPDSEDFVIKIGKQSGRLASIDQADHAHFNKSMRPDVNTVLVKNLADKFRSSLSILLVIYCLGFLLTKL